MTSLAASPLWATEINLHTNTTLSSEGYFVLTWDLAAPVANHFAPNDELALLQADNSEMQDAVLRQKLPLQGAITLSGLDNGNFYFRVDAPSLSNNASSNVVQVEVKHHSLNKAFAFFTVGLMLFCILGVSIFIGHRNSGIHAV